MSKGIKIDVHNRVKSDELEAIIRKQVKSLIGEKQPSGEWVGANPQLAEKLPPTMIWGPPGVGKSTIVKKIAESMGIDFIDVRLAQMEPTDLKGLPVPDDRNRVTKWYLSDIWPRDPAARGILFFDELSAADRSNQVAAYQIILDRCFGREYTLPKGYYICAAGNRVEDMAVATTMSSALATRVQHFELEADTEDWIKWAYKNSINPAVIGYLSAKSEAIYDIQGQNPERGFPCPRTWERVSTMIDVYGCNRDTQSYEHSLLQKIVYGNVGDKAGVEFMAFYDSNMSFEDVLKMMTDPSAEIVIPVQDDQKYALVTTVTYYLWRAANDDETKKRLDGFFRILAKLGADFASLMITRAVFDQSAASHAATKIMSHPDYKKWEKKFTAALRQGYQI